MGSGLYRLFLAALVVAEHTGFGLFGGFAVFSFFIVSGYWIASKWLSTYSKLPFPWAIFIISRLWRVYPAFAITAAGAMLYFASSDPANFNFFTAAIHNNPLVPQAWSLAYEAQFYVLAPIFIAAILSPSLLSVSATVLVAAAYVALSPRMFQNQNVLGVVCLAFFLIGIAGAGYKFKPRPTLAGISAMIALAVVALILSVQGLSPVLLGFPNDPARVLAFDFGGFQIGQVLIANAFLALTAAGFTFWTLTLKSGAIDRALGEISYTLYLTHIAVSFAAPHTSTTFMFSTLLAILLWVAIMPCEWLRRKLVKGWPFLLDALRLQVTRTRMPRLK